MSVVPPITEMKKSPFLQGVFAITFSVLIFQIAQTRVLSVIAWYYLAFFAISVAMLGMTVGAVWVYLKQSTLTEQALAQKLSQFSLYSALSMPASLLVQFSLITAVEPVATTFVTWGLLLSAMATPYVFAGVVVSLALTRSPFPINQVYGVDMLGAAMGCLAVLLILNIVNGPSAIILAGAISAFAAHRFAASLPDTSTTPSLPIWQRPLPVALALVLIAAINNVVPVGLQPIMVKNSIEHSQLSRFEQWNSYSRIIAYPPRKGRPYLWGPSPEMPADIKTESIALYIDGAAGTSMYRYDGSKPSVDFLKYDLVNLAYTLPRIDKAAIIGVGGGRDIISAHLFGATDITGVELNPIFVDVHVEHPFYREFSNLQLLPNLKLHVDDARSWFASTSETFDLVQMSMIDTWAATGAGAFSLSENGLYTLEGWRAFINRLNPNGLFTVSRWYNPGNVDETGRMIGLATAAVLDAGNDSAVPYLFVAYADHIATLVLSRSPLTTEQISTLRSQAEGLGFQVLLAPDQLPESPILRQMILSKSLQEIDAASAHTLLDLTVPTDNRPFFFNQLEISKVLDAVDLLRRPTGGVLIGNLKATVTLVLILLISLAAVILTILIPLRNARKQSSRLLITTGTLYFSLIGMGFMFAEIALLQYFSVYLGHPIYSLGICLFSLIFSTGLGSLAAQRLTISKPLPIVVWGVLTGLYLFLMQHFVLDFFHDTTALALLSRIALSLALIMPLGFLLGFAFPTGMRLTDAIDTAPGPWFWGINGATGVLSSVLAVMLSMAWGIDVTMTTAGFCYLLLIPIACILIQAGQKNARL